MKLRSAALAVCLSVIATAAGAQMNSFQLLNRDGRQIGVASYTIEKQKDGFRVRSKFAYKLGVPVAVDESAEPEKTPSSNLITEAEMTGEYKLAPDYQLVSGFVQNRATQMITSLTPSKTRDVITVSQMQGGVSGGSQTLPMPKPAFYIAPDFDPGAMQALLLGAIKAPHADHVYLLVIPGMGGPKGNTQPANIAIGDPTDASGTLDGKPIALKHYDLQWNKAKGELWADADGNLMEVKAGTTRSTYVRVKFALPQ